MLPTDWETAILGGLGIAFKWAIITAGAMGARGAGEEFGRTGKGSTLGSLAFFAGVGLILAMIQGTPSFDEDGYEVAPGRHVDINERWAIGTAAFALLGGFYWSGYSRERRYQPPPG